MDEIVLAFVRISAIIFIKKGDGNEENNEYKNFRKEL